MEHIELIQDLKRKKELKDLDNNFIKERINEYLKDKKLPSNKRSKEYKEVFKDLRKQLRKVYGVFRQVEEGRNPEFYKLIFNKIKPKKILEFGCGLDPLHYSKLIKAEIYATDISESIINKIKEHFKENKIKGKAFIFNLIDDGLDKLPKVDLCLMLRLLDSLEYFKRDISKEILKNVKAENIVVSFPIKSLSGKKEIKVKVRKWFIKMLKELEYKYEIFNYENEVIFLIRK